MLFLSNRMYEKHRLRFEKRNQLSFRYLLVMRKTSTNHFADQFINSIRNAFRRSYKHCASMAAEPDASSAFVIIQLRPICRCRTTLSGPRSSSSRCYMSPNVAHRLPTRS